MVDEVQPLQSNIKTRSSQPGWWGGRSAQDALAKYKALKAHGVLKKAHYLVEFEPFSSQLGAGLHKLPLFAVGSLAWLASSTSLSLIDVETDSVKVGHYQHNYVTGQSTSEFEITMIETEDGDISNSLKAIKALMFFPDGTQGLPASYMFYIRISLFKPFDESSQPVARSYLVSLQSANIDLEAASSDVVEIPITLTKMYPFEL
jgi:hypothetical protein